MTADEHKPLKEVDHELAERAEALEDQIKQAEAKHPLHDGEAQDEKEPTPTGRAD